MITDDATQTVAIPCRPVSDVERLSNRVEALHHWVTFLTVLVFGMVFIVVVALLQLGGFIRWFG